MSDTPKPAPLRAAADFLDAVMQSTDGTTYSRRIRADLEVMGVRLTRDGDAALVRLTIDETLRSPSVSVLRHLRDTSTNGVENVHVHVDPVTRDFIEMRGCSVAGVLMACRLAQDVELEADDIDSLIDVEIEWRHGASHLGLMIELAPRVLWKPGRVKLLEGMPATWANSVIGRRMDEVVAHPLLDRHGMTITDWNGVDLMVEYDGSSTTVLPAQGGRTERGRKGRDRWRRMEKFRS